MVYVSYVLCFLQDLFKEELKKHDSLIGYIKQNLAAQENILNAVTEANVRYAKIKKVVDSHKKLYVRNVLIEVFKDFFCISCDM